MKNFEPTIVAFCCQYCAYTAADTAGMERISYPANVKIIPLPCSCKIDALYLLRAFEKGADGVYVAGCLEGDCHFINGNDKALNQVNYVKTALAALGVEPERLEMVRMSAGQGRKFADFATAMTERIKALGPSPLRAAHKAA